LLDQEQAKPSGHYWGFAACDEKGIWINLWCSAIELQSLGSGKKQRMGLVYAWRNGPARMLRRKLLMACWRPIRELADSSNHYRSNSVSFKLIAA
jgi:hypothetical protein